MNKEIVNAFKNTCLDGLEGFISKTRDFLLAWKDNMKPEEYFMVGQRKTVSGSQGPIMTQFTLLGIMGFHARLHFFYQGDKDYHSHPRHFISIGLMGRYRERLLSGLERTVKPGTITVRCAQEAHNVEPIQMPCVTFALTTPVIRKWEKITQDNHH